MKYTTGKKLKTRVLLVLLAMILAASGYLLERGTAAKAAEGWLATCWALCKPGAQVNVRRQPSRSSMAEGFLEAGDEMKTDGTSRDGWIRVFGIGEDGAGWVYCGYVVTEKPQVINEQYVCVAKTRVACRRWMGGPQVEGKAGWLKNGENVQVFYIADGWAVTSRGYIRSEWLEADPR